MYPLVFLMVGVVELVDENVLVAVAVAAAVAEAAETDGVARRSRA